MSNFFQAVLPSRGNVLNCVDLCVPAVPAESEELEPLYSSMAKVITDGLLSFEKNSSLNLSQLQCTLMILKAASTNNPGYMDRWVSCGCTNNLCIWEE
jgi:hypothetical protein